MVLLPPLTMSPFPSRQVNILLFLDPMARERRPSLRCCLTLHSRHREALSVNGLSSTHAASRTAVGYLAENYHIPSHLSGWQYLQRCAELLDISRSEATDQCRRIVELIGMQGREHTKTGTYSKGMIQRFGLGAALIGNPKLLILDEPTSGLDPIGIREIRQLLESLKNQGMTIFLNSHLLSEVEKICDNAAIINRGRLLVKDKISALVKDGDTLEDVFVRFVKG